MADNDIADGYPVGAGSRLLAGVFSLMQCEAVALCIVCEARPTRSELVYIRNSSSGVDQALAHRVNIVNFERGSNRRARRYPEFFAGSVECERSIAKIKFNPVVVEPLARF